MTSAPTGHLAERTGRVAVGAIYLLAGVPEAVELCLNMAGGLVDTHVLMTLAALGLLALGQAPEARFLHACRGVWASSMMPAMFLGC